MAQNLNSVLVQLSAANMKLTNNKTSIILLVVIFKLRIFLLQCMFFFYINYLNRNNDSNRGLLPLLKFHVERNYLRS